MNQLNFHQQQTILYSQSLKNIENSPALDIKNYFYFFTAAVADPDRAQNLCSRKASKIQHFGPKKAATIIHTYSTHSIGQIKQMSSGTANKIM
jgi:hypothetical protein